MPCEVWATSLRDDAAFSLCRLLTIKVSCGLNKCVPHFIGGFQLSWVDHTGRWLWPRSHFIQAFFALDAMWATRQRRRLTNSVIWLRVWQISMVVWKDISSDKSLQHSCFVCLLLRFYTSWRQSRSRQVLVPIQPCYNLMLCHQPCVLRQNTSYFTYPLSSSGQILYLWEII